MPTIILIDELESVRNDLGAVLPEITPLEILPVNSTNLHEALTTTEAGVAITDPASALADEMAVVRTLSAQQIPIIIYGAMEAEQAFLLDSLAAFNHGAALDITTLAAAVKELLEHPADGHISGVSLPSFLQLIELDRKSCTLRIKSADRLGVLYFRDGELLDAYTAGRSGEEAALEIIGWPDAAIELHAACRLQKKEIDSPLGFLLIESARRDDEKKHKPPAPAEPKSAVDQEQQTSAVPDHLAQICRRINAAVTELAPESPMLIALPDGRIIMAAHGDEHFKRLAVQTSGQVNDLNELLGYSAPQYILLHPGKEHKLLIIPGPEIFVALKIAAEIPVQEIATSLMPLIKPC